MYTPAQRPGAPWLLVPIVQSSLEHRWFWKIILWSARDSDPHLRNRITMLPSPPCYLVYKSLWERTVSHPAEVQLLPQKGSIIVWRAQSVSALQTGIKKTPQPNSNPRTLPVSSCQPNNHHNPQHESPGTQKDFQVQYSPLPLLL